MLNATILNGSVNGSDIRAVLSESEIIIIKSIIWLREGDDIEMKGDFL